MILAASLLQLNALGAGIIGKIFTPQESAGNVVVPTQRPTPVKTDKPIFTPERIIIKKVNIDLPVVSVPLKNGTWYVNPKVANFAEETSLVNPDKGNVGIFAHDRIDGFSKIKEVLTGSDAYDIILIGNNYRAIYKPQSASVIAPTAIDVFYPTEEPILTLITCDGLFSEKRYMVRAKLVKIEKIK
jgi:sortase A